MKLDVRNLMAHGDAREEKWRGKMRMEWVASSLALYVGTRSIQSLPADPHSSTASSRLNWHPRRFKWTRPFPWKTKSGFCACAITFRTCYNRNEEPAGEICHQYSSVVTAIIRYSRTIKLQYTLLGDYWECVRPARLPVLIRVPSSVPPRNSIQDSFLIGSATDTIAYWHIMCRQSPFNVTQKKADSL